MNPSLQQVLLLMLAAPCLSAIGSSLAGILSQDGFSEGVNGTIAWAVLILAALGNMALAHQLTLAGAGDVQQLATYASGAYSLLISGSLHSLRPWTSGYLPYLKSHVFSIVKAGSEPITAVRPAIRRPLVTNAVQPPKPIQLPTRSQQMPPPQEPDLGG